jgi:hypothetical protein
MSAATGRSRRGITGPDALVLGGPPVEATLVALLAPFLPHLLKVGEGLADDAARALAGEAGRHIKAIWNRMRPGLEEQPDQLRPASDLAANPDDQAARGAFQYQLRNLLSADPALAEDIARLVDAAGRAGVVATQGGVAVGGSVVADRGSIGVIGTARDVRLSAPTDA